jgi:hypothetical protein
MTGRSAAATTTPPGISSNSATSLPRHQRTHRTTDHEQPQRRPPWEGSWRSDQGSWGTGSCRSSLLDEVDDHPDAVHRPRVGAVLTPLLQHTRTRQHSRSPRAKSLQQRETNTRLDLHRAMHSPEPIHTRGVKPATDLVVHEAPGEATVGVVLRTEVACHAGGRQGWVDFQPKPCHRAFPNHITRRTSNGRLQSMPELLRARIPRLPASPQDQGSIRTLSGLYPALVTARRKPSCDQISCSKVS